MSLERKYLKYKKKYFGLKELEAQLGGVNINEGIMCVFTTKDLTTKVKDLFNRKEGKLPVIKVDQITSILDNNAYMVEDGVMKKGNKLKLLKATSLKGKKDLNVQDSELNLEIPLVSRPLQNKPLFNRCDNDNLDEIVSLLNSNNFVANHLIVIKISKSNTVIFMYDKNLTEEEQIVKTKVATTSRDQPGKTRGRSSQNEED